MPPTDVARRLKLQDRLEKLWKDQRFLDMREGGEVRQLAEALMWATHWRLPSPEYGEWITKACGAHSWDQLLHRAVGPDVPRYLPPDPYRAKPCPAKLTTGKRAGEECGKRPEDGFRVTDPITGQWTILGYCRSHRAHSEAARIAERVRRESGSLPEPMPNVGGLLPCHLPGRRWADYYAAACWGNWEPPAVGLKADDWPVMAKVIERRPPKLVLVRSAPKTAATLPVDVGESEFELRSGGVRLLKLVRDDLVEEDRDDNDRDEDD